MRILHLVALVFGTALIFSLMREPSGRVAVVVFFSGLAETAVGLMGVMTLFQTLGSIGEARGFQEHAEAFAATVVVTVIAATLMLTIFALCIAMIAWAVPQV